MIGWTLPSSESVVPVVVKFQKIGNTSMKPSPGYQVMSNPELLDKIFETMDIRTLLRARTICRRWRSVSELYLKRRMSICHLAPGMVLIALNLEVQEVSLLNKKIFNFPEVGLILKPDANSPIFRSISYYAPLSSILFELDWLSNIVTLSLHESLTVDDWMTAGCAILKKMTALSSLMIQFRAERSPVVSLYFSELQKSLGGDADARQFEALRQVDLGFHCSTFKDRTRCDEIFHSFFDSCPNLKSFTMSIMPHVSAWVSRCKDTETFGTEMMPEWEGGFRLPPRECKLKFSFGLANFLTAMLKRTQLQKLDIPADCDILPLFVKNASTVSRLKFTSQPTDAGGLTLSILQWCCSRYSSDRYSRRRRAFKRPAVFPNVRWLQLNRNIDATGRGIDWIDSSLVPQLLPNVVRLVINFCNLDRESKKYHGDLYRALRIASSFRELEHLVLLNDQPAGTATCSHSLRVFSFLKGLKSLTLSIKDPLMLRSYARCALVASQRIPSLTQLGFYRRDINMEQRGGTAVVDLKQIGVAVPRHVVVTSGAWTSTRAEEAGEEVY